MDNIMSPSVQPITHGLVSLLIEQARSAPRLRTNHNFHQTLEENPNRFLNVMVKGTYFTPHRHADPPKPETIVVLEGSALFIVFDDLGEITQVFPLGDGGEIGVDMQPGVWHTMIVLSEAVVVFEVKPGPYTMGTDKEFAPWAPREGEADCKIYAEKLLSRAQQF